MPRLAAIALLAVGLLAAATAASARPTPLPDAELDAERGGLRTPFGFDIGFGAVVRTYLNGELALETRMTWTAEGPATSSLTPGSRLQPTGAWAGLTVPGNGSAGVLHQIDPDRILSVVVNTASNQTIRQDTEITLNLPQLDALQRQMGVDRLALTVQAAVGAGLAAGP